MGDLDEIDFDGFIIVMLIIFGLAIFCSCAGCCLCIYIIRNTKKNQAIYSSKTRNEKIINQPSDNELYFSVVQHLSLSHHKLINLQMVVGHFQLLFKQTKSVINHRCSQRSIITTSHRHQQLNNILQPTSIQ